MTLRDVSCDPTRELCGDVVASGVATFPALCGAMVAAKVPDGPAIARMRPHQFRVLPEPGPLQVETVHAAGSVPRVRILVVVRGGRGTVPDGALLPTQAVTSRLALPEARLYPAH